MLFIFILCIKTSWVWDLKESNAEQIVQKKKLIGQYTFIRFQTTNRINATLEELWID
jgi:hypothetical protein